MYSLYNGDANNVCEDTLAGIITSEHDLSGVNIDRLTILVWLEYGVVCWADWAILDCNGLDVSTEDVNLLDCSWSASSVG